LPQAVAGDGEHRVDRFRLEPLLCGFSQQLRLCRHAQESAELRFEENAMSFRVAAGLI
jgi:hypothetical protein